MFDDPARMDPSILLQRIAQIAPDWNPFPLLQQLQQQPATATPLAAAPQPQFSGWMDPSAAAPVTPPNVASLPTPPGARIEDFYGAPGENQPSLTTTPPPTVVPNVQQPLGAAPLTPQQMLALRSMTPPVNQVPHFAPAVSPQGGRGNISFAPFLFPAATRPAGRK